MGLTLIIAHEPDEPIDTDYFVERLRKSWPEAKIQCISVPNAPILQFRIEDGFGFLGDFLGTGVSYEVFSGGRIADAQFALWYRTIVPDEWELKLYDSGLSFAMMTITGETTQEQIIAGFSVPFDPSIYE